MRLNHIDRVLLFGGAPLLVAAARWLKDAETPTRVYTSPRHAIDTIDSRGTTLSEALEALSLPVVVTDDINTDPGILGDITPGTLGIGFGEAWSFGPPILSRFGNRLFDFMGIPHPRYRGGAHYTWMILRGDRQMGCNIQVINEDMVQGEFDSGEIVKSMAYELPPHVRTPQNYFDEAIKVEVAFLREFLQEVQAGHEFHPVKPDESRSLFLPRLNTRLNGWIDWSWSGTDIERFICAFDEPYPGASTQIGESVVQLKGARMLQDEAPFHPFQSGLITRIYGRDGVVVATSSGHLSIQHVLRDERCINHDLKCGMRFITSIVQLEQARAAMISYGARPNG